MKIHFSHCYKKLLDTHNDVIEYATLLEVIVINLEELSREFIDYDTDDGKYVLPKFGKYLMLIFKKPHENFVSDINLFTTLRRSSPSKFKYYISNVGKRFEIEVLKK